MSAALLLLLLQAPPPKAPDFDLLLEPGTPPPPGQFVVYHPKRKHQLLMRLNVVNRRNKETIEAPDPGDMAAYVEGLSLRTPGIKGTWVKEVKKAPAGAGRRKLAHREFFGRVVDVAPLLEPDGKPLDDGIYLLRWQLGDAFSDVLPVVVIPPYRVTFETNRGSFSVGFYPDVAPMTVLNFMKLVKDKFYEEQARTFHRILPGRLVQGGCPNGDGTGHTDPIKGEFNPHTRHMAGALSMARVPDEPDSASCQFFLCADRIPEYDGRYALFGRVLSDDDLNVLRKIAATQTTHHQCPKCDKNPCALGEKGCGEHHNDKPISPVTIQKVVWEELP